MIGVLKQVRTEKQIRYSLADIVAPPVICPLSGSTLTGRETSNNLFEMYIFYKYGSGNNDVKWT